MNTIANDITYEQTVELRRLELEEKKVKQEHELRLKEIELKEKEGKGAKRANPLVVSIVAATIAAAGNAYVSWLNGSNQLAIEATRNASQKEIEREKAEAARILEATKASSPESIEQKIRFLISVGLISDPNRQAALNVYLTPKEQLSETLEKKTPIIERYSSEWLTGGNNKSAQCSAGRAVVSEKYPDKVILLKSSSGESTKDILGRVGYKYFCVFEVY